MDTPSTNNLKTMIMRRGYRPYLSFILALILAFCFMEHSFGQGTTPPLETLEIELWPDFDQPSTLVLMTGSLPASAQLPATVTLPIPIDADINAVARIDSQNSLLTLDYDDTVSGQITFTTPDPQFRIEYYQPYLADGNQRIITFSWQANFDVEQLSASVQQPSSAANMNVTPEPSSVNTGLYGLLYHVLPNQSLPATLPFTIEATYEMNQPVLSQSVIAAQEASSVGNSESSATAVAPDTGFNWPLVLAIAAVALAGVAVVLVFINSKRSKKRELKPKPVRRSKSRATGATSTKEAGKIASYCHKCGEPARPEDKFCRNCGTQLKQA